MSCGLSQDTRIIYSNARKARSNIDEETRLIENRIRMIHFEEERAQKRIQETREKIDEVYKARSRFIEDQHNKNIFKEREVKTLSEVKDKVRSNREFQQEKINYTQMELVNVKQNLGKRVRGWKEFIRRNAQQQSIEQKRYNRKLKETVKMSSKQGSMRLKLLNDIKEKKAKFMYNRKVEMENLRRTEIEQKMTELGKEEQELMQRLADIHDLQKQTVNEYEKIYN